MAALVRSVMRLLDQIALAREPVVIQRPSGQVLRLPGAGSRAGELAAAPLRYVLDPAASQQCAAFIGWNEGMFDPRNELLRVFADRFWLEWRQPDGEGPRDAAPRAGILVQAEGKGRRGVVQSFWEAPGREPEMAQARVEFDFDLPISGRANHWDVHRLTTARGGALARLVDHLLVRIEPQWLPELSAAGPQALRQAAGRICAVVWRDLVFALAFSALLVSTDRLAPTPVERERLNRQRAKRGKPLLLDHTEVTLSLGDDFQTGAGGQGGGGSSRPRRLHYVRGHMVRRYGKVFWRMSHLRGEGGADPLVRTVRVRGGRKATDG
ncbi:MAG TPA: hypothetical protein VGM25_17910 [Caulobacteraceae bacterium]